MESERVPVIILAGGKSSRFGRDKASEVLAGKTLLQRAVDASASLASRYVIVCARGQRLPPVETLTPLTGIEDAYPETGPLGGIFTGLMSLHDQAAGQEARYALVVACDMPLLQPRLLRELVVRARGYDAVVPKKDGLPEPLCAVYRTSCTEAAKQLLERGEYKVAVLFEHVKALSLAEGQWRPYDPNGLSFLNVNRPGDIDAASALIDAGRHAPEV